LRLGLALTALALGAAAQACLTLTGVQDFTVGDACAGSACSDAAVDVASSDGSTSVVGTHCQSDQQCGVGAGYRCVPLFVPLSAGESAYGVCLQACGTGGASSDAGLSMDAAPPGTDGGGAPAPPAEGGATAPPDAGATAATGASCPTGYSCTSVSTGNSVCVSDCDPSQPPDLSACGNSACVFVGSNATTCLVVTAPDAGQGASCVDGYCTSDMVCDFRDGGAVCRQMCFATGGAGHCSELATTCTFTSAWDASFNGTAFGVCM
jgi:hypothetical protein